MAKNFFELRTWQESHALFIEIYTVTADWPKEERYGLTAQLRSAAVSIPSNIAEGTGRATTKDLVRFLVHARGSAQEVIYQIFLAQNLGYISSETGQRLMERFNGLGAGINSQIASLNRLIT